MIMSKLHILILGLSFLMMAVSCTSTNGTKKMSGQDESVVQIENHDMSLSDHLSKLPGVTVSGSGSNISVNVRGAMSFQLDTEPLFVVNGQQIGHSYAHAASQLSVTDILSVKVVKGSEASTYGVQGGNGVIEITTKGN